MTEETMIDFQERCRKEYGPMYYDREGKEMELMEWSRKCEDMDYKIVKQDIIDRWFVSTVWVGLNMKIFRKDPIQIFETMIFMADENDERKKDDSLYLYQERYSTEEEALRGHEESLSVCRGKILLEKYIMEIQSPEEESEQGSQSEDPDQSK